MLDFRQFQVLTFDCYGTLINWEDGLLGTLRGLLSAHGKQADDAMLLGLYGEFEAAAEHGEFQSYRDVLASVVRQFAKAFKLDLAGGEIHCLSNSLVQWKPWPDTVPALQSLSQYFRLAIITNVDDNLFAGTRPKLEVDFTDVVTAQQARVYKPSLKIFNLALQRLEVSGTAILHVGQSAYHDVIPAQSLGISTVWVNRPSARSGVGAVKAAEATPDLTVQSLAKLAEIVRQSPS